MKKLILTLAICSILPMIGLMANPNDAKNAKPIFAELLEAENIDSYQIPTFLIKFTLRLSDESKDILPLFKGSHSVNIAVCDDHSMDYNDSFMRICKKLDLSTYQNLVDIVDNESKITIKALWDNNIIKELVILIHDEESLIALSMTGEMNPHSIADAIAKLNSKNSD